MEPTANPYASPQADEVVEAPVAAAPIAAAPRDPVKHMLCWAGAVAINLPLQVMLGIGLVDNAALVGVLAGFVAVFAAGGLLLLTPAWFSESVTRGTALFALTQFFPLIQTIVGIIAVETIQTADFMETGDGTFGVRGLLAGFVSCLFAWLMFAALMGGAGLLLRLVLPRNWWRFHPGGDSIDHVGRLS